jgi:hypothetical protein
VRKWILVIISHHTKVPQRAHSVIVSIMQGLARRAPALALDVSGRQALRGEVIKPLGLRASHSGGEGEHGCYDAAREPETLICTGGPARSYLF